MTKREIADGDDYLAGAFVTMPLTSSTAAAMRGLNATPRSDPTAPKSRTNRNRANITRLRDSRRGGAFSTSGAGTELATSITTSRGSAGNEGSSGGAAVGREEDVSDGASPAKVGRDDGVSEILSAPDIEGRMLSELNSRKSSRAGTTGVGLEQ